MAIEHAFAGVPVADLDRGLAWYERLFGRPPDGLPNDDEAVWQLAEGAALYLIRDGGRAGTALLTLIVDDLDERLAALRERGLEPSPVAEMAAGRKATVVDTEGNAVTFAQLTAP